MREAGQWRGTEKEEAWMIGKRPVRLKSSEMKSIRHMHSMDS